MTNFTNKTVVVSGGAGLIGSAVVRAFEEQGASVIVVDVKAHPPMDIADPSVLAELCRAQPDVFVDCSGYVSDWMEHSKAVITASEVIAENMAKHGGGAIVLTSSIYGLVGPDHRRYQDTDMGCPGEYSFAKGGIISFTKWLATTFGAMNVRANCIAPGGLHLSQPKSFVDKYCHAVPMGRMGNASDVVGAVLFLCSDSARYITGVCVPVDGGMTSW